MSKKEFSSGDIGTIREVIRPDVYSVDFNHYVNTRVVDDGIWKVREASLEKFSVNEIDWASFEGKEIEVSDDEKNWYRRKLIKYVPEVKDSFVCFSETTTFVISCLYARLIKENR